MSFLGQTSKKPPSMTQTKQEDFIPFKVNDLITVIRKGSKIIYGWNERNWCVFQILNNRITNVDHNLY